MGINGTLTMFMLYITHHGGSISHLIPYFSFEESYQRPSNSILLAKIATPLKSSMPKNYSLRTVIGVFFSWKGIQNSTHNYDASHQKRPVCMQLAVVKYTPPSSFWMTTQRKWWAGCIWLTSGGSYSWPCQRCCVLGWKGSVSNYKV